MILRLLFIQFLFMISGLHPVHVSITNMHYDENEKEINFSTKIFKKDFQLLFVHLNEINVDFDDITCIKDNRILIEKYIDKSFKLYANGQMLDISLDKIQTKSHDVWLYGTAEIKEPIQSIKIINTLLLDLYFDQKNLVILSVKGKDYSHQFEIKNTEFEINEF